MGVVGRLDQYASMLASEFDDYSMSENLFLYSEQFDNAVWTSLFGQNAPVTVNQIAAPDGTITADLITFTPDGTGQSRKEQNAGTRSGTYTASIFVKNGTIGQISLYVTTNQAPYPNITYNFTTDTITSGGATGTRTLYPNGWVRITATATVTSHSLFPGLLAGSSGTLYAWGAQVEGGSVATDYTPTSGTAISRVLPATTNTNITGLGTYYSSGFDENVGFGTFLPANVFAPYNPVYDEFSGTLFGAGQGRYMRQNTDKTVIVYNEIDEVTDFRDIVRTGLVLDLDAAQPLSYGGTGTTWNDLSGNGNNGTLTNGPTYDSSNGGSIVFDGVDDKSTTNITSFGNNTTWEAWVNRTTNANAYNMFMGRTLPYFGLRTSEIIFSNTIGGSQQTLNSTGFTPSNNTWYYLAFTTEYDGANTIPKIYPFPQSGTEFSAWQKSMLSWLQTWLRLNEEFCASVQVDLLKAGLTLWFPSASTSGLATSKEAR